MRSKKLRIFLISLMTLIFSCPLCIFSNAYLLGDIDKDGTVTAADARLILRASVGLEILTFDQEKIADLDFDLAVTAADARLALRTSVGLEYTVDIYEAPTVCYISNRSIQYDKNTNYFTFIFSLLDEYELEISAPATVYIRFENSNGEIVYQDTRFVVPEDFSTWKNGYGYQFYAAAINISADDIIPSMDSTGTFYYQIVAAEDCYFDEFCLSVYDLPEIDITEQCLLNCPQTPCISTDYNYGNTTTTRIDNITYTFTENSDNTVTLIIYISGQRIDNNSSKSEHCYIGYKIIDAEGYVIKTSEFFTPSLAPGEKFKDVTEYLWTLTPGTYTLQIIDSD